MKEPTPKQWIRNVYWIENTGGCVCDGCTTNFSIGYSILYPFFIITGLSVFLWIFVHWEWFKDHVKKG